MPVLSLVNNKLFCKMVECYNSAFEWGSGESTLYMARNMNHVVSIEHNSGYYSSICNKMPANVVYKLVCPDQPHDDASDGSEEQYDNYCKQIDPIEDVDLVIIDGRARTACAFRLFETKTSFRRLLVHDFFLPQQETREMYNMILSIYTLCDWHDGLAVFEDG